MNLLYLPMLWHRRLRERQLRAVLADPAATQTAQLQWLLRTAADTVFGREHGLAGIGDYERFRRAVPLREYRQFEPYIRRQMEGEGDVLWPGVCPLYARTSGTTAGSKYIPVTRPMYHAIRQAGLDAFIYYGRRRPGRLADLFRGRFLFLGGSTRLEPLPGGAQAGDLSAIGALSIRWPATTIYEPGRRIALIDDWEAKLDAIARRCRSMDIRLFGGVPTWFQSLFDRLLGSSASASPGGSALREAGIWPNLRVLLCGGMPYQPFVPLLSKYLPPDVEWLEVYAASEGPIAIQSDRDDPGLLLNVGQGLFFEFVPWAEWGRPNPIRLSLEHVQTDVDYVLVLNTSAGLFGYLLGDVVRFTSLSPPKIRVTGRIGHLIDILGERVSAQHCEMAVAAACQATGAQVVEFTAAPLPAADGSLPRHEYLLEFDRPPLTQHGGAEAFAAALDQAIQRFNVHYASRRKHDLALAAPCVQVAAPGTFRRWMQQRGKLGGQNKVPHCANHRDYINSIQGLRSTEG